MGKYRKHQYKVEYLEFRGLLLPDIIKRIEYAINVIAVDNWEFVSHSTLMSKSTYKSISLVFKRQISDDL